MSSIYKKLIHYKSRFSNTIFSELKRIKKLNAKKTAKESERRVLALEQERRINEGAKKNIEELQKLEQFKLYVYYHDVLRYTIFSDLEKVATLRRQGFYVDVKIIPKQTEEVAEKPA